MTLSCLHHKYMYVYHISLAFVINTSCILSSHCAVKGVYYCTSDGMIRIYAMFFLACHNHNCVCCTVRVHVCTCSFWFLQCTYM